MSAPLTCLAQSRAELDLEAGMLLSGNPFLLSGNDLGSSAVEIQATPNARLQVGYATSLELDSAIRLRKYQRLYGDFVTGHAEANARHRDSERLTLRGALGYTRQLPTDVIESSLDAALDTRTVQETFSASTHADWSPSATTVVNAGLSATRTRNPGSALLLPVNDYELTLVLDKRLSARTTAGVRGRIAISDTSFAGSRSAKSLQFNLAQRLSEHWRADVQTGIEWADIPRALGVVRRREHPRFTGSGSLCNEGSRFMWCLAAAIRSEVSSLTGLQRELTVGSNGRLTVSQNGEFRVVADYRELTGGSAPLNLFRVSADYEHRLDQRFSLKAGVDYLRRDRFGSKQLATTIVHVTLTARGLP